MEKIQRCNCPCGHEWFLRSKTHPEVCPHCGLRYWRAALSEWITRNKDGVFQMMDILKAIGLESADQKTVGKALRKGGWERYRTATKRLWVHPVDEDRPGMD